MRAFPLSLPRIPTQLPADWRRWLPRALEVLLVLVLLVQAVRVAVALARPWLEPAPVSMVATVPLAEPPPMPTADMFYRRAGSGPAATGAGDGALGYRLFGVRADAAGGSAILGGKDGAQRSWPVGAEVAPGVVLASVGTGHAVLAAGGRRHRLDLPGRAAVLTGATATSTPTQSPSPTPASAPAPAPARTATPTSPAHLLSQGGLKPRLRGGLEVTGAGDSALLRQAGLQAGDILLSVNGQPISLARLDDLEEQLQGQSTLTLQYERDGDTRSTSIGGPR